MNYIVEQIVLLFIIVEVVIQTFYISWRIYIKECAIQGHTRIYIIQFTITALDNTT